MSSNFNPLPPQGKTQLLRLTVYIFRIFQSTSPTGEDTDVLMMEPDILDISIHFPHRGRHSTPAALDEISYNISIHFPHRGRHMIYCQNFEIVDISIHFPHRGRHTSLSLGDLRRRYFNPLPPQGKTQETADWKTSVITISIHFPHRGRHICFLRSAATA